MIYTIRKWNNRREEWQKPQQLRSTDVGSVDTNGTQEYQNYRLFVRNVKTQDGTKTIKNRRFDYGFNSKKRKGKEKYTN